jgi:hypothetical protein
MCLGVINGTSLSCWPHGRVPTAKLTRIRIRIRQQAQQRLSSVVLSFHSNVTETLPSEVTPHLEALSTLSSHIFRYSGPKHVFGSPSQLQNVLAGCMVIGRVKLW